MDQRSDLNIGFLHIFLDLAHFNCWNNLPLSWVDKATTGTYSFVSVISSLPTTVELVTTQVDGHVRMRLISIN